MKSFYVYLFEDELKDAADVAIQRLADGYFFESLNDAKEDYFSLKKDLRWSDDTVVKYLKITINELVEIEQ